MIRRYQKNNPKAHTLVELLVSVAIFTALVGVLHTVFASGKFSWASYENRIIVQREVRQAIAKMTRELRLATNVSITQFAGSSTLDFTRTGIGDVSYQWSDSGLNAKKILRVNQGNTTILANNISLLSFASDATSITVDVTALKALWGGAVNSYHLKQKIAFR